MALGSSWGTREEMLHPRDRRGRFRKKWKMPDGVINKLQAFLERFNPRTFQSDQQASQYVFNKAKPGRFPGDDQKRLHMDWDEANDHIRAGDIDPSTQRFIDMMEGASTTLPDQAILHRTVGPEAFGLTPDQLGLEDGGLEDFTGRLIADRAYGATNIGSPMGTGPGRIHMTIATPHGQPVIIPGTTPNDRRVFLPRDQGLRITKVEPDGTGGWHVMAIAEPPGVARKTPEPVMPGRRGAGLSEAQREERITPSMSPEQRQQVAQQNEREMQQGPNAPTPAPGQPVPAQAAPAPASPSPVQGPTSPATGVPERQEPLQKEAVGPTATEGASPAEVAQAGEEAARQAAEAQAAPAPATPESFRQALSTAKLKSPSRGKRQKEFNDAFNGIVGGKVGPEDALRQLDTDIEVNKRQLERQKAGTEKADPELEQDIQDQEALADLISSHHGIPRRGQSGQGGEAGGTPAPAKAQGATPRATKKAAGAKAAPTKAAKAAGPTPTPGAPSTSREATPAAPAPKKAAKRAPAEVADSVMKAASREEADAELDGMLGSELRTIAEQVGAPIGSRATKAQMRRAITERRQRQLDGEAIRGESTRQRQEAGTLTDEQQQRIVNRAKDLRGKEANDEDRRLVAMADEIEAGGTGEVAAKKALDKQQAAEKVPAKKAAKAVAKKAVPAKAAPSPVDDEEEAFKARVAEAGLPDRVTALRDMARTQKIRGFSTMNKKQLQAALLGDEVPKAGKIGVVSPEKMIPHLEAADSDQAARALLANHTLVDLKALAKKRELKLPSKGATKAKVMDMVLEDIRGPQTGIEGRTPDTSLEEDLGNLGYIDLPGSNGNQISQQIAQVDGDDPDSLRQRRDDLEKLSKQFRKDGDKNAANMAQAAADAMGMRAQTISGVEEATPPVKRVAKKAAPEVDADVPEVERPIEKMLKPELLALAQKEGASVRPSWTKARILDEIKKNRRVGTAREVGESEEDRLRRELGALPGGPERDLGPIQGPLRLPDRAPTAEEIARDNPDIPAPAPVKKATKKAAKKAVAQVDKAAANMAEQVRGTEDGAGGTFGDMLKRATPEETEELREEIRKQGLEPKGKTAEELFDNSVKDMLANRMRELGMLPDDPKKPTKAQKRVPKGSVKGPKADVLIATEDRRRDFIDAWNQQPGFTDDESMVEIRDRIADGEFTHEEGVRRLESEIAFNEEEISDLGAELRGMAPEDRDGADQIQARRAELQDKITAQKKAVKFLRGHAKSEAPVTRQELEIQLDGPELAALQRADVEDLKKAARDEGLGNIEGDDKDTVVQNIGKAVARREMANREKEQKARDRQAEADRMRNTAEAIASIDDVLEGGSDRAVQTRIQTVFKQGKIDEALRDELLASDRDGIRTSLVKLRSMSGLRASDKRGDKTHFNPERHELPPGSGIKKGDPVTVLGPGFRADVQGDDIQVHKARVTAGHEDGPGVPETPSAPEAPATPPRTSGTAVGRITTARLTPGTRIMVQRSTTNEGEALPTTRKTGAVPVTVTKIERNRLTQGSVTRAAQVGYRVTAKDDDGNEVTIYTRPGSQTHMLEPAPKAAKVAKAAVPAPETPAAPKKAAKTQDLLGELINDDNPLSREEVGTRIADLDRAQLQEMAKALNIPAGSRRTIPDTRRSIVEATVGRRLDSIAIRGFRGDRPGAPEPDLPEGAPARVLAESHQVTSTPLRLPSVAPKTSDPEGPKRHNAELIGAGLDIDRKGEDRQWMDVVQADLDRGIDGRQIADGLRREADTTRTLRNIGDAVGQTSDPGPAGQIERMERMADRLEAVRPIAKPVGQSKLADQGRKDMSTMSAASAQSKAFQDLKAGKSHTEVATALRQAATSVGSRDHDVQPVRVQDFTPAERTAMKRSDAKKLRELAAEIQAQGVTQRAAAKAAKKAAAPAKKAAPKTPEQDRKDLTGTTGELATAAIDAGLERLQAASTPEQESDAFKGILLPELKTMAGRLGLKTSGSKAALMQRIADRVKGREAPTTSAERAVPKVEAPGGATDGLDDMPEVQLRRLADANGMNGNLNLRQELVKALRAKGVVAPPGSGSLAAERAVQDSAPVKWSYVTRDLSSGGDLLSPQDRAQAGRILTQWTHHEPGPGGGSEPPLNSALRGGKIDPKTQADIDAVDRMLEASRLPRKVTVYRGYQNGARVLPEDFSGDLTGHTWTDPAYTATTSSEYGGQTYAGDAEDGGFYARITLPRGFPAIGIQDDQDGLDDEGEMILPRGLEFRVTKDHGINQDGIRELDIEVRQRSGPVAGVDYSNPALLEQSHTKDAIFLLNQGDTPEELIEEFIGDGLSPDMARLLITEIANTRDVQMPKVVRDAIDEQIRLRGRTAVPIAEIRSTLKGIARADFDRALRQLASEGRLLEQENRQRLTPADRDEAFKVGARTYHLIRRSE